MIHEKETNQISRTSDSDTSKDKTSSKLNKRNSRKKTHRKNKADSSFKDTNKDGSVSVLGTNSYSNDIS